MSHFLDYTGLQAFWTKAKQWVLDQLSVHRATVVQTLTTGTQIGTVDGTALYAPTGGASGDYVAKTGDTMTGDLRAPAYYVGNTVNKTTSVTTDTDGTMFLESFVQGPNDATTYGSILRIKADDNNPYYRHFMNDQWGPWRKVMLEDTCPFPVGGIYISVDSANPSTIWGGTTWEAVASGRFLVGASSTYSAGSTGDPVHHHPTAGHTLTAAESGVPAHSHVVPKHSHTYTRPTVSSSGAVTNGITGGSHRHASKIYGGGSTTASGFDYTYGGLARKYDGGDGDFIYNSTHTHNLPNHTHTLTGGGVAEKAAFNTENNTAANAASSHSHGDTGDVMAIPPWFGVYMWKRTA